MTRCITACCSSPPVCFCHCVMLWRSLQLFLALMLFACCILAIKYMFGQFFSVVRVLCSTAKSKHPDIEMTTSALAISNIGALVFLIPVKGWKAGGAKVTVLVICMKPHMYNVTFGPLSTDPVRNAVLSLFCECAPSVGALLLPIVAGGFACPCHLCLCAQTSWRWHDSSRLCAPLQGAKSFCNPCQGRCSCILVTQRCALEAVLNLRFLKVLVGYFCL